jgi:pimeloyl-ACP methyl ester carboxylesterase
MGGQVATGRDAGHARRGARRGRVQIARLGLGALVVALAAASLGAGPVAVPALAAQPTPCAAVAAGEPQAGHTMPPQANALFAADFPALYDCEWGYRLGGFGGHHAGDPLTHTPVIFVHGNQADAENWYLVADQFKSEAGYTDQELYALSYNGLENGYAGLPTCCSPAAESTAYWQNTSPPYYEFCCNGGHGASDDPNVPDLYAFVLAVQQYTGSQQVDIVAHSLGVTITRKMLAAHPELRSDVLAAVMIAGANHGTTVCRGLEASYYGCEEIAPGSAWLSALNAGGESPGPTHWMSVYNGTDNTDPFFQSAPGVFDDRQSPHLDGADFNVVCAQTYHNDLRVRPDIVHTYLDFLLSAGQSSAFAPARPPVVQPSASCSLAPLGAQVAEAPQSAMLLVAGCGAAALAARRRRRWRALRR